MSAFARRFGGMLLGAVLAAASTPLAAEDGRYRDAELDRLLAPIALYPDSVLSHVLIAATYPLEVVQAARWSRAHPALSGEAAVEAVEHESWDPSVKALAAFPEILARMDEDLEWTSDLGHAFLDDESQLMDRVQVLREHAYDAGRLDSLDHVRVVREREIIYIEPAVRDVVYVPYYDPWHVYGTWWWPDYPPYCWRSWHGRPAAYYRSGFYWGVGFHVAPAFYFTGFHWPERHVVVVRDHARARPIYSGRDLGRHPTDVRRWRHDEARSTPVQRRARQPQAAASTTQRQAPAGRLRGEAREPRAQPAPGAQRREALPTERPRSRPDAPPRREPAPRADRRSAPSAVDGEPATSESRRQERAARHERPAPPPRAAPAPERRASPARSEPRGPTARERPARQESRGAAARSQAQARRPERTERER